MNDNELITQAFEAFDLANAADPHSVNVDGADMPKELCYAQRLTEEVMALAPEASVALQLASRCQHICRWMVPRSTQPMGRAGYLKWREGLKSFHAEKSAEILLELGCDAETVARVQSLNQKKNIKSDPECQTLEDALCIVFLKYQFDDLIANTEEDKMVKILQKSWAKMSEQGHAVALALDYSETGTTLIQKALA